MSTPTATSLPRRRLELAGVETLPLRIAGSIAVLALLMAASVFVRSRALAAGLWIDEGLSVGISSFPLTAIPELLRQDGSPPLYYLLLHVWMSVFGSGEEQTHALSLSFAVLSVPAGLWAGWSLFGQRTGWVCAVLCALNPFLTIHAQETRMYALVVLLSLLATATFAHAFVHRSRAYVPVFAVLLAAMLYTHNWALFYTVGALAVVGVLLLREDADERRRTLLYALVAFGAAGLLYAPWLPTLLFQSLHTGAPWSNAPSLTAPLGRLSSVLGGERPGLVLLLAAGVGLVPALELRLGKREHRMVLSLVVLGVAGLGVAWLASQVAPAFTTRYLAALMGPLLLLAGYGLSRAGRLGLVALAIVVFFWTAEATLPVKGGTRDAIDEAKWLVGPGDLVISTQPERVPVLDYYMPENLAYATPLGRVSEPRVMDWRDAQTRLEAARPATTLAPLLDALPEGRNVAVVRPVIDNEDDWQAPWTRLVRRRSAQWGKALDRDPRFVERATVPAAGNTKKHGIRIAVYTKAQPPR